MLAYAKYIMGMKIPDDAPLPERLKIMGLKKEMSATIMAAAVRVNDTQLRRKETDKVGELLRKVKARSQPAPADEVTKAELFN